MENEFDKEDRKLNLKREGLSLISWFSFRRWPLSRGRGTRVSKNAHGLVFGLGEMLFLNKPWD